MEFFRLISFSKDSFGHDVIIKFHFARVTDEEKRIEILVRQSNAFDDKSTSRNSMNIGGTFVREFPVVSLSIVEKPRDKNTTT